MGAAPDISDLPAPSDSTQDISDLPVPPPRVSAVEEDLAGPSEVIGGALASVPYGVAKGAENIYRSWTGGDRDAPDNSFVHALEPTHYLPDRATAAGRQMLGDTAAALKSAFPTYTGPQQPDDTAVPEMSPTTQNIGEHLMDTASDVGSMLPGIPAAGKIISAAGDLKGVTGRVLYKVADPSSPVGKALGKTAAVPVPEPAAPTKPTFDNDVPSANTPPPDFTPPKGAPAASAAEPITDAALTKAITTPAGAAADDAAAQARFASMQRMKEDGLKNVRESAVSGDRLAAATDYAASGIDKGAGGNAVAEQLANEKEAMTNGVNRMIAGTGGSVGTDSFVRGNRGETILQPLDGLDEKFRAQEKAAYAAADTANIDPATGKGIPIDLDATSDLINNQRSVFRGEGGAQMLRDIKTRARELGVWDDANDRLMPATVQQAEQLRQYVGGGPYDPKTSGAVRAVKDALAVDVTKAAGSDVYKTSRDMRTLRARLLEDPDGISKIIDSSGPDGINRKVDVEKVPDALMRLGDKQFNHVIDTIEGTSHFPELKPKADAALAEIRGHMLQRAKEAALPAEKEPWAAQRFTKYLQDNRAKFTRVFKPSELEQLESLNRNGHYLDIDRRYKGSAVQAQGLLTRAKMMAVQHGAGAVGASAGGFVGGHIGAAGGTMLGEKLGHKWAAGIANAADRTAWKKRVRPL
jgi:hypothetical protein